MAGDSNDLCEAAVRVEMAMESGKIEVERDALNSVSKTVRSPTRVRRKGDRGRVKPFSLSFEGDPRLSIDSLETGDCRDVILDRQHRSRSRGGRAEHRTGESPRGTALAPALLRKIFR